jgi:hypothetical protein
VVRATQRGDTASGGSERRRAGGDRSSSSRPLRREEERAAVGGERVDLAGLGADDEVTDARSERPYRADRRRRPALLAGRRVETGDVLT